MTCSKKSGNAVGHKTNSILLKFYMCTGICMKRCHTKAHCLIPHIGCVKNILLISLSILVGWKRTTHHWMWNTRSHTPPKFQVEPFHTRGSIFILVFHDSQKCQMAESSATYLTILIRMTWCHNWVWVHSQRCWRMSDAIATANPGQIRWNFRTASAYIPYSSIRKRIKKYAKLASRKIKQWKYFTKIPITFRVGQIWKRATHHWMRSDLRYMYDQIGFTLVLVCIVQVSVCWFWLTLTALLNWTHSPYGITYLSMLGTVGSTVG